MQNDKIKDADFGARLLKLRTQKSLSRVETAKQMCIGLSSLQQYERGVLPGPRNTEKIRLYYKCQKSYLLTGEGESDPGTDVQKIFSPEHPYNQPDEFVLIERKCGQISAGGGLVPDNDADVQLAFRRDWIKKKGNPGNMSLIKVSGDSMDPTLLDGDLVLVNHSRNSISPQGGIYAIAIDDEIMIKRVQPADSPEKILVISDNKQYPHREITTDKVRVNGKVIWYARDLER
jgi:phage repressor protein C with HTH and peptisase S24 domain